jgi:hypothetical protein
MSVTSLRGDLTWDKCIHWYEREECNEASCQRKGREFKITAVGLGQCNEVRADGHDNESKQYDRHYSKVCFQKGNERHMLENHTERDQTENW